MKFRGVAFRAHDPRWAWSPLSGEGANKYGGRLNRIGQPARYFSLDLGTAICEASQGFAGRFPPLTIVTYDVDVDPIADLCSGAACKHLRVAPAALNCSWLSLATAGLPVPTWDIADGLIAKGFAGVIVRSFSPGALPSSKNLVLWKWSEKLPHKVAVFDPQDRLKRLPITK